MANSVTSFLHLFIAPTKTSGTLFTRWYVRFASPLSNAGSYLDMLQYWSSGGTVGLDVAFQSSTRTFRLKNEITASSVAGVVQVSPDTWYRLELRHLIASAGGELELRLYQGDSTTPLETLSLSPGNTLPNADVKELDIGNRGAGDWAANGIFFDDIAISDDSGTFQNSWPGPGNIVLLKPTFNNSVAWTPNPAGTLNASNITDEPGLPDDDSTYNSISDTVSQDKFFLSDLPTLIPPTATFTLAQVFARAGSNQAAGDTIRLLWWDENDTQITGPTFSTAINGYRIGNTNELLVVNLATSTRQKVNVSKIGYIADSGSGLLKKVTALWANVEYQGSVPSGVQVSSRSDTLSNSQPSATSNHTIVFTVNSAITASSSLEIALAGFSFPRAIDCNDVDVATGTQFSLSASSVGCEVTATQWGVLFAPSPPTLIITSPTTSGTYVATGTQITIKVGSNAISQQQGAHWITNPSTAGIYTIAVGGTFGGSGNILVSINSGVTVQATVAESLALTVSSVAAVNCTADDGATVTAIGTSPTTVSFGAVPLNTFYIACQDLVVSTNAGNGYSITTQESSAMKTVDGRFTIPDTTCDAGTCTESVAAAWTNATKNGLGHTCFNQDGNHDCDSSYSNGTKFRQFANIAAGETAQAIMSSSTPASVTARIKHRLSVGASQVAGTYTTVITYTIYATY